MPKTKYGGLGWVADKPDHRDRYVGRFLVAQLPPKIDMRAGCPPVFDQGDIGSCTANAIVAAMMMATAPMPPMLSRLFVYYNERDIEGTTTSDAGAEIRDGFKTIAAQGVCLEATWPYDPDMLTVKPDSIAYDEAKSDVARVYARVSQELYQLKAVLAGGHPFVFGFTVYESFESQAVANTGMVPMPSPTESVLGGHAVLAVGYDDSQSRFIVRNSWGPQWGIGGYFMMPYEYVANQDLASDIWVLDKTT